MGLPGDQLRSSLNLLNIDAVAHAEEDLISFGAPDDGIDWGFAFEEGGSWLTGF